MGFLEISRTQLSGRDLRRDRQHRRTRAMSLEQPVDQVQISRATAARAHRKAAGQVRFGRRGERGHLLVPYMDPFDLALPPQRIGNAVQAVADDAVDSLHPGNGKGLNQLISDGSGHVSAPWILARVAWRFSPGQRVNRPPYSASHGPGAPSP